MLLGQIGKRLVGLVQTNEFGDEKARLVELRPADLWPSDCRRSTCAESPEL